MSSAILTAACGSIIKGGMAAAVPRALATVASGASFKLPDMPYDYGALEPFISGEIMKIHHTKHHQVRGSTGARGPLGCVLKAIRKGD
jgi:Fe-Mn family superoxide dismutase